MVSDFCADETGRPFRYILRFSARTAYPFAVRAEAEEFACTFDPVPQVVSYSPPSEDAAAAMERWRKEASDFYSVPCRFSP